MRAFENIKHVPMNAGIIAGEFELEVFKTAPWHRQIFYRILGVPLSGSWVDREAWLIILPFLVLVYFGLKGLVRLVS